MNFEFCDQRNMRMRKDARISNPECNGLVRIGCFLLIVADVGIGKEWITDLVSLTRILASESAKRIRVSQSPGLEWRINEIVPIHISRT